jgi:DNA polymerase III subunit alpha
MARVTRPSLHATLLVWGTSMPRADFIHLRVHSAYSLSEGAVRIAELARSCAERGMPAVAITDTGNLFGALEFSLACAAQGVQPIIGCQLAITGDGTDPDQLVLLVQSDAGWQNLIKLVSKAFLEGPEGEPAQVALDDLEGHSDGLIALSGGVAGPVGRRLAEARDSEAEAALVQLEALFPGRLYIEVQRHALPVEDRIEDALIGLAYSHDLPLVATNEAYFADAPMHEAHDALLCIANGTYVSQDDRPRVTASHHLATADEMRELFADLPEAIDNTLVIAKRCAFMVERRDPILPSLPELAEGTSEEEKLRADAKAGLMERLGGRDDVDPYRERLDFELGVIVDMGFAGYFLIVAEFIHWAKEHGIPVGPGRGSGAGSVVAWALKITDLDPLRFGLLFERFLNPERVSMPDFDIDFCQDRRDEVIRHVQEEYGRDRVAQIITFGKLQARAVLRDVGRVLQMPYGQVDRLCKMVPNNPANPVTLQEAITNESRLREERDGDAQVARLLSMGLQLEGLYRHASTHAAGLVIGDRPLDELVPLYRDPRSDMPVTQFNMKYVEQAGLVKFDFLGLKTLTVIERARLLLVDGGESVDIDNLPLDDAKTYGLMSRGETVGVFQFESSGMRNLLREAGADNIEDIIALVALFRPGPMENIPKYIACKHGNEEPEFLHDTITPITSDTYGVIIYQEQVMQIAQVFAGYSLGRADLLRRAMGKKDKAEMAAQRQTFTEGAMERGVDKERANTVFDLVDKFAGYGFNKAHSAGYALIAYQTAYLKANHPVAFMAASMTLDSGNTDKLNIFRQELARLKIALHQPDINLSGVDFGVEGKAIRYALAAIKNVGAAAMTEIVKERDANGPFRDLFDFANRIDPHSLNKRQLENLAKAGAFDSLDPNRAQVAAAADVLMRHANLIKEEQASSQENLFGDEPAVSNPPLPVVNDWPMVDRLQHEFEALGFYLSAHPLDAYADNLEKLDVSPFASLAEVPEGRIAVAGVVLGKQERNSQRGRFAFVQMSDQSGLFEVAVFSERYAGARELIEPGQLLRIEASLRHEDDQVRLTATKVEALDERAALACTGYRIFLASDVALPALKGVVERERNGTGKLCLMVPIDDGDEVRIDLEGRYVVGAQARAALKAVPGVVDVHDL